jgi:hypothetical protein
MRRPRGPPSSVNAKYDNMMKAVALTHTSHDHKREKSSSSSDSDLNWAPYIQGGACNRGLRDGKRLGKDMVFLKLKRARESSPSEDGASNLSEVSVYCPHKFVMLSLRYDTDRESERVLADVACQHGIHTGASSPSPCPPSHIIFPSLLRPHVRLIFDTSTS